VFTLFLSIGIWYNCTNQFIVQRCLGARSEWDARMGVLFAGYMKILLPFLVVLPGIVAFHLFPGLADPDQAYPVLVKNLVPAGLGGVVMAGIASALLSHLSSVLNSSSTVFTMDLYRPLLARDRSDERLVAVGRWSAFFILLIATSLALYMSRGRHSVFLLIQNIGAWVAAPISVIFLLGALWKRATAQAATVVLVFGFPYTALMEYVLFKQVPWLQRYDNWLNRTFAVWATCMVVMVAVSYLTPKPAEEQVRDTTWSKDFLRLPEKERATSGGLRSLALWWGMLVAVVFALYTYLAWFQVSGAAGR
jgi:SSS family solute:Na+ symporter